MDKLTLIRPVGWTNQLGLAYIFMSEWADGSPGPAVVIGGALAGDEAEADRVSAWYDAALEQIGPPSEEMLGTSTARVAVGADELSAAGAVEARWEIREAMRKLLRLAEGRTAGKTGTLRAVCAVPVDTVDTVADVAGFLSLLTRGAVDGGVTREEIADTLVPVAVRLRRGDWC